jgi:hypothetical protein
LEDSVHPTAIFEGIISARYEHIGTIERTKISTADKARGKKGVY